MNPSASAFLNGGVHNVIVNLYPFDVLDLTSIELVVLKLNDGQIKAVSCILCACFVTDGKWWFPWSSASVFKWRFYRGEKSLMPSLKPPQMKI